MSDLREILQAQTQAMAASFESGRCVGYRQGFNDGIAEAQKIVQKAFPDFKFEPTQKVSA